MPVNLPTFLERVGRKLGILPVGQSLSAEDGELILEKSKALQAQLEKFEIVTLDFSDGIDDSMVDILVDMCAALLVDDFMIQEPNRSRWAQEGILGLPQTSIAERRLRKLMAPMLVLRPVRFEAF